VTSWFCIIASTFCPLLLLFPGEDPFGRGDTKGKAPTGSREKLPFLIAIYFTPVRLLINDQSSKAYFHHGCLYPRHLGSVMGIHDEESFYAAKCPITAIVAKFKAVGDSTLRIRKGQSNWSYAAACSYYFFPILAGRVRLQGSSAMLWWNAETLNALRICYANRDNGIKYREYKA
jgi:hypothetical protein